MLRTMAGAARERRRKEKGEEVASWTEQKPEVKGQGLQTSRCSHKSVAVGEDAGGQALVVAPIAPEVSGGASTAVVVVPEDRKRPQPEREGGGGGKKQVVGRTISFGGFTISKGCPSSACHG